VVPTDSDGRHPDAGATEWPPWDFAGRRPLGHYRAEHAGAAAGSHTAALSDGRYRGALRM
jgi:hypothetical protein